MHTSACSWLKLLNLTETVLQSTLVTCSLNILSYLFMNKLLLLLRMLTMTWLAWHHKNHKQLCLSIGAHITDFTMHPHGCHSMHRLLHNVGTTKMSPPITITMQVNTCKSSDDPKKQWHLPQWLSNNSRWTLTIQSAHNCSSTFIFTLRQTEAQL